MPFNIYDVSYSQCSHQHVAACIPVIFRVMSLLQEYNWSSSLGVNFLQASTWSMWPTEFRSSKSLVMGDSLRWQ